MGKWFKNGYSGKNFGWPGLMWLMIRTSGGNFLSGNEIKGFLQCGEFVT
jgi:hypothetical protein